MATWRRGSAPTYTGVQGARRATAPQASARASASARTYASSALPWLALCTTTSGLPPLLSACRLAKSDSGNATRLLGLVQPRSAYYMCSSAAPAAPACRARAPTTTARERAAARRPAPSKSTPS